MMPAHKLGRVLHFGVFEVDLRSGQLRKGRTKIRLQEQPFRILELLLERPGEVVSREEIREKLWPADTFVEFEHSLNTAVNRLRAALGDSATEPRYIETVPRRGYRFIGRLQGPTRETAPAPESPSPSRQVPLWQFAAVAVVAVGALVWRLAPPPAARDAPLRKFTIQTSAPPQDPVISPDGRYIAYKGQSQEIWIHDLAKQEPRRIGTKGGRPFWSPGSDFVGIDGWTLMKIPLAGGPETNITERPPFPHLYSSGVWSQDGQSVFIAAGRLWEIPSEGGPAEAVTDAKETYWRLSVLPGDRKLLVASGELGLTQIVALDLDQGRREVVAEGDRAVWSATGHVVYESKGNLWAVPFSPEALRPTGEPFPICEGASHPSVAIDGTLVYLTGQSRLQQLVWKDRSGRETGAIGQPLEFVALPELAPDDIRVLAVGAGEDGMDVWIYEVSRPQKRRVTFNRNHVDSPAWTPTGDAITFTSPGRGGMDIFVTPADSDGAAEPLVESPNGDFSFGWSADGRYFTYEQNMGRWDEGGSDIWYLRRKDDGGGYDQFPFHVDAVFDSLEAELSPDGSFIAYSSNETGTYEIYIQRFPEGGRVWTVSTEGGRMPRWRGDGKELFYVDNSYNMMAVPVTMNAEFSSGTPRRLFNDPNLRGRGHSYDVTADGQRFVVKKTVREPDTEIHVVQNWIAEFQER